MNSYFQQQMMGSLARRRSCNPLRAGGLGLALCAAFVVCGSLLATAAQAVVFTTNTVIEAANTTYDGQDITVNNCTLTVDGPHAFNSLQVRSGGVVTHSPATASQAYSLQLAIAGALTIDASSVIDVTGRGYLGGADGWK